MGGLSAALGGVKSCLAIRTGTIALSGFRFGEECLVDIRVAKKNYEHVGSRKVTCTVSNHLQLPQSGLKGSSRCLCHCD